MDSCGSRRLRKFTASQEIVYNTLSAFGTENHIKMKKISDTDNYYPLIFISDELSWLFEKEIPLPNEEPKQPSKPYKENTNVLGCLIVPALFLILAIAVGVFPIEVIILITAILLIAVFIFWFNNAKKANERFNEKHKAYEIEFQSYLKQKRIWDEQKRQIRSEINTLNYRQKFIADVLKKSQKPNHFSFNKKGISEDYFENYLNRWFKGKIFKNYSFFISDENQPYQPDFIFQDTSIHIDIEVDEPYIYESGVPIHFINEYGIDEDILRNSFFVNQKGWVVIRFSEEQIIKQPNECCKVIAKTILDLTGNSEYYNKLTTYGEVIKIKKWTFLDAKLMAEKNIRKEYLSAIVLPFVEENTWNSRIMLSEKETKEKPRVFLNKIAESDNLGDDLPF